MAADQLILKDDCTIYAFSKESVESARLKKVTIPLF